MSTYLKSSEPRYGSYQDVPAAVREYLHYSETIRGLSPRSVNAYYIDLRTFFKYLIWHRGLVPQDTDLQTIEIVGIDLAFIEKVSKTEIYEFLYYVTRERDNASATRARKLSTLKGFFRYLNSKTNQLSHNPAEDVEAPKIKKSLPKYLSLEESILLLKNIQSDFYERDYCIITLFLNCGMRLSELVGLNVQDVKEDTMRLLGKGNKERVVYLNDACRLALETMLEERAKIGHLKDRNALFVSKRTGRRLSARRVQQVVSDCLQAAGLDGKGYSVHKLRHTAATLMHRYGHVDMLALKEILGHANVGTTQIYTHLDQSELKDAASASPLSSITAEKSENKKENVENPVEMVEKTEEN